MKNCVQILKSLSIRPANGAGNQWSEVLFHKGHIDY